MNSFGCHYFASWPYDDALIFMHEAWLRVRNEIGALIVGCGSHRETVITAGRNAILPLMHDGYAQALCRHLDRGGGVTAHEPGQIVLYPIFHAHHYELTPAIIVEMLEQTMIDFLRELGVQGARDDRGPGVFVDGRKIGFIGLRIKEHIVQHGLAINLFNDAAIFRTFDPCGVKDLAVTSACFHASLDHALEWYQERLVVFFLRNWCARTKMGTSFDVGVLLSSATDSSGTSTLPSGK